MAKKTLTIFDKIVQGEPAWHDQRRGIVTASVVAKLLTTSAPSATSVSCSTCDAKVGEPCISTARKSPTPIKTFHDKRNAVVASWPSRLTVADNDTSRALTGTLAAERITGWTEDTPMTSDMWRGVFSEPIARDLYGKHYAEATEVGFMRLDGGSWTLGYSPDGLVGSAGLIEVKAPRARTHLRTILADEVPAHNLAQCQAGLLVSGREWLDFVSFCGGMPLFVKRIYPDPEWAAAIQDACQKFEESVAAMVADFGMRVVDMPVTERIDSDLELVI